MTNNKLHTYFTGR